MAGDLFRRLAYGVSAVGHWLSPRTSTVLLAADVSTSSAEPDGRRAANARPVLGVGQGWSAGAEFGHTASVPSRRSWLAEPRKGSLTFQVKTAIPAPAGTVR